MIVMNAGVMEQFGTPEEVYHTPDDFVASFIGSPPMNLLRNAPNSKPGTIWAFAPNTDITSAGWEVRGHGRCWAPSAWCTPPWG